MAKSGVSVRGISDLQRFLLNLAPRAKREIKQVTEATGRLIEAEAKQRAPVDTGKLRQSITYEPIKGGMGAMVSVNVPYGLWIEFGTGGLVEIPEGFEDLAATARGSGKREVNIPAQPYLIPAWLKYKDRYYQGVQDALDRIFK